MIEYLLLDLDDTILDFKRSEEYGIRKTLRDVQIEPSEENCLRYSRINQEHWKRLEKGEITRQQVIVGRFAQLFAELGSDADPEQASLDYMQNISGVHYFLPGAREAVEALAKKYRLFLVSNGTASVQHRRLSDAKLYPYFEKIFISQEVGVNKPAKEFFDRCFAQIEGFDPARAMIVGDSLSSDILGGIHAGVRTCWVNPGDAEPRADIRPDHTIASISQLQALLDTL